MSEADSLQQNHRTLAGLGVRLEALRAGSDNWHEWHQAGVLTMQVAQSAYLKWGMRGSLQYEILNLLNNAGWLYTRALGLTNGDQLASCAVLCDMRLKRDFKIYCLGQEEPPSTDGLEQPDFPAIIRLLETLDPTPARHHQLAIAHSFLARAKLWQSFAEPPADHIPVCGKADLTRRLADKLFLDEANQSPDDQRAHRSHLLVMASIYATPHTESCSYLPSKRWRRRHALLAFRLAWHHGDYAHMARALAIGLYGVRGERWAQSRWLTRARLSLVARQVHELRHQLSP